MKFVARVTLGHDGAELDGTVLVLVHLLLSPLLMPFTILGVFIQLLLVLVANISLVLRNHYVAIAQAEVALSDYFAEVGALGLAQM